ncbi:MAG: sigma-54 dependent transcriptional regulator [Kiritimatiellia bacterium]
MSRILIVDDEARILLLLESLLKSAGFEVTIAHQGQEALEVMNTVSVDIVLTDLRMAPMDGMSLFAEIRQRTPEIPVILLTAYASVETAIEAMKQGIFDYITKPFKVDELLATMRRADRQVRTHASMVPEDPKEPPRYVFEHVIASSEAMASVCDMMRKIAPSNVPVLINGESGTGKEVIAKTIHSQSLRKNAPWVAVNCAALPEALLESEMFGHVKGAFTGANSDKEGLFDFANGGTLFLDEISSFPLALQGKLLRVLQEHEVRRVGGLKSTPVDVRIIAASNADLEQKVVDGLFRADLYYRLAVVTLEIPPLRDRKEDILPLCRHFIWTERGGEQQRPSIANETAALLLRYSWPGNVRELENAMRHALTFLQEGAVILPEHLPPKVTSAATEASEEASEVTTTDGASLKGFLRQKEKEYVSHILSMANGDKAEAAKTLNVSLATLYRKLSDDPDATPENA